MTDTTAASLPTSNQDPAAVAAAIADPDNGITKEPVTPVGIKIDPASAQEIGQHIADAINSTAGQQLLSEVSSGIPKKARGVVYGVIGAVGSAAASIVSFAALNPGVLPEWLLVTSALIAAPCGVVVGTTGLANLGKK